MAATIYVGHNRSRRLAKWRWWRFMAGRTSSGMFSESDIRAIAVHPG